MEANMDVTTEVRMGGTMEARMEATMEGRKEGKRHTTRDASSSSITCEDFPSRQRQDSWV